MKRPNSSPGFKGFTAIELIAVLLLVGILASVAGLGIVQATKAFIFTKNTTEMGQKNILAMTRLRRSIANITLVTTANTNQVSLDRLQNGEKLTETYSWSGTAGDPLTLTTTDSGGTSAGPYALADNVQGFSLDFQTQSGNSGSWSVGDRISTLAYITVDLTLAGGDGTQTMQFSERIVPRNTYIPSDAAPGTSQGTTSSEFSLCFIKSRLYRDAGPGIVNLYRDLRSKLHQAGAIGTCIETVYRKASPVLCRLSDSIPGFLQFFRFVFAPVTALLLFAANFPWALVLSMALLWAVFRLSRLLPSAIQRRRLSINLLSNPKGSILVGIIITMVIMAALSVAMLNMFSSSSTGSVSPQFSQQAYYLAESGLAYAAQRYLKSDGNDTTFINALNLGNPIPVDSNSFLLTIQSYWFTNSQAETSNQITASPLGAFPDDAVSGLSGYIQIPISGGRSVVKYTNTTATDTSLSFSLNGTVSYTAGDIFPAFHATAQTVRASELGEDPDLSGDVLIAQSSSDLTLFPKINGIINFTDPDGNDHVLVYRKKSGDRLTGLQYPKGVGFSPAGITIENNTDVVLGKHAIFTSTGTAGSGPFESTQTIKLHQPLSSVELFKKIEGGISFDAGDISKIESKLGTHTIEDGALKVTSTEQTYSYTNYTLDGDTGPVLHSESLAVVNWDDNAFETDFLKNIWEKSDQKLSYDLQAKVKFTEAEDDVDASPINHPGCYMPGLSFRIRSPKTGDFGQASYYGLSFMRGITGLEQHSEGTGDGWGSTTTYTYTENDDITDNLFSDHASTSRASDIQACPDSGFSSTDWDDDPPLDSIPYIVLWQKDVSTDADGDPVNTGGCIGGTDYSPWEWLAYAPLVEAERVQVYHYIVSGQNLIYEGGNADLGAPEASYWMWKLKDRFGILETTTYDGVEILGSPGPGDFVIRDPATYVDAMNPGTPVTTFGAETCPVGYILEPASSEFNKAESNYKIYIKPWATLLVRVYEMSGNLDCNDATGDANGNERVNAITAYIADPDGVSGSLGYTKDAARSAYARGTVKWTHDGDYFTQIVWEGLRDDSGPVTGSESGYTSKTVDNPEYSGCGDLFDYIKIVEKGKDSEGNNVVVYTATYTTEGYFQDTNSYTETEFGLHTLGINGESDDADDQEIAFFDDFYWLLWEGGQAGLFPGIQEQ